jgi:hypothetical protein
MRQIHRRSSPVAKTVRRVQEGPVVPGERLASTWGLTRQALAPAAQRGEIFAVKVGNRLYDPQAFLGMDRQAVATLWRALGELDATGKPMFWLPEHGSQAGQKVVTDALGAGIPLAQVERLAATGPRNAKPRVTLRPPEPWASTFKAMTGYEP